MPTLTDDLAVWLGRAPATLDRFVPAAAVDHVGTVRHVGDGVAQVVGLPWTRLDEVLAFEDGSLGLAFQVDAGAVGCVLLSGGAGVVAGAQVRGTGTVVRVPVGPELLGRVIDPTGAPLDGGPAPAATQSLPIERPAPAIVDRALVTQPLLTGITVVDAMIPLGRGQRELIIGDRKTGKTAIAVDTVINQRGSDVVSVYAVIGQKASTAAAIIEAVRRHGAFERCVFVVAGAGAPPGAQWIAPYAACAIAEYFRDRGQHALLVFDDLTKHAIVYRQIALLLRRPPGREAYPGDIFYVHARLLERAARLSDDLGGGSLTALPIAETQAGNLSAYIPTNLISITDGQIYLEPKLFYEGQKPAVNVGLSVSRVGGKTQPPAIGSLAESLKLDYAQFLELEIFTRFGAMTDERTRARIAHGNRIRAILAQPQYRPLGVGAMAALLLAVREGVLDPLSPAAVETFKAGLADRLAAACPQVVARIDASAAVADEDRPVLLQALSAYAGTLAPG
ncbi:MAG: F0F1 ATP synthase subunit alpha [Alphaproteobacteria bacterium]